jgi:hypothetical protein
MKNTQKDHANYQNSEVSLYDCSFSSDSDVLLLKALSLRLSNTFGLPIPFKNFEVFCRTIENLTVGTCNLMSHDIECSLSELYGLREKICRIIQCNNQQSFFRTRIKFGALRFNLKINRNDEGLGSKDEISQMFSDVLFRRDRFERDEYLQKLEKNVIDLEFELEKAKISEYLKSFPKETDKQEVLMHETKKNVRLQFFSQEFFNLKKFAAMQCRIINEKEFDAFDTKILKAKFQKKLKKMSIKKSRLIDIENQLRKKNLEIEKEKTTLEKNFETFESQKSKQNSLMQQKLSALSNFLNDLGIFYYSQEDQLSISLKSPGQSMEISNIDTELKDLSSELKTLEFQYKSRRSLNKNTLESQIEKVKNRISTLKSFKVIQNVSKPSQSTSSSSFLDKNLSPRHFQGFQSKPEDFHNRPEQNDSELRRQLRVKELRIKEKEEEILDHEARIIEYWKDSLQPNEVLSSALKALNDFKEYRDKYERRVDFVEKKRLELQDTLNEITKRENQLEELRKTVESEQEQLDSNKFDLSSKVKNLMQILDKKLDQST